MNFEFLIKTAEKLDRKNQASTVMAANAIDMAVEESLSSEGENNYHDALGNIAAFATWLDAGGFKDTSHILDCVLEKAAELATAKDKYDYKAHREESLFTALTDEAAKAKEPELDTWRGGGHPLLTRYSPDYPGVMLYRVSDGVYQDMLSKKVYDFKNGFISDTGTRYYGGSVAYQTPSAGNYEKSPQIMESRHLRIRPQG